MKDVSDRFIENRLNNFIDTLPENKKVVFLNNLEEFCTNYLQELKDNKKVK